MKVGDVVRVLQPYYAAGRLGVIEGSEPGSARWIIKLEATSVESENKPVRLSLPESEFEVIEADSEVS